jgi:hypothetical protein
MNTPPLGFITPAERNNEQHDAHAAALAKMVRFTLPPPELAAGAKVVLSEFWNKPEVVAETGLTWDRSPFHQLTGSCVGCGGGNALYTLMAVQRCLSQGATKAFVPFWPFNYGRCRSNEGDRGQGEGAMGSSFAEVIVKEGIIDAASDGLTQFQKGDGLVLTSNQEMQWSDGASSLVTKWVEAAKVHPVGSAAPMRSAADIKAAVTNGYPITFACNNYIGNASVTGSGEDAAVVGYWDGNGGHQQWVFGYWDNPTLGPLYAVGNNWPKSTYPKDPAGLPLVCCWVKEAKVDSAIKNLDAEVYALSHLTWFPAQNVLSWLI